jgi:predicted RNA methylase
MTEQVRKGCHPPTGGPSESARRSTVQLCGRSLRAAQRNATTIRWQLGDAQRPQIAADRILTNPPWDVRLAVGDLTPYLNNWQHTDTIVNQHQVATLTDHPAWTTRTVHNLSLAGLHPSIVVLRR